MLKLPELYLSDEQAEILIKKLEQYNTNHDPISLTEMAKLFLEYGIKYLDVSAID